MKKIVLLVLITTTLITIVKAQAPQQLNYQGIARNASGQPITFQNITVRLSFIDSAAGGQVAYQETRRIKTNYVGLFNIVIGSVGATNVSGTVGGVNWSTGRKYIKLEIDPHGLNDFSLAGITQLQSVPYALSATPSGYANGDLTGTYPAPAIANNAVTTGKIADGSITLSKLAPTVINTLANKVNISDTALMLNSRLKVSDTANMLKSYYSSKTAADDLALKEECS